MTKQSNPVCVMIADDLTGACDAGVQFAKHGLSSTVLLEPGSPGATADVVIGCTASRDVSPQEAIRKVCLCGSLVHASSRPVIFKKIDSTLRGHVIAEIVAAMRTFGRRFALIAPAFPDMGRVVHEGIMHVTDCAGARTIDVASCLFPRQTAQMAQISGCALRSPESARAAIAEAVQAGASFILVDGESNDDLRVVVEAGAAWKNDVLWVGSAGLALPLAGMLGNVAPASTPAGPAWGLPEVHKLTETSLGDVLSSARKADETSTGPAGGDAGATFPGATIFCVGSTHAVTVRQREYLVARTGAACVKVADATQARAALEKKLPLVLAIERGVTTAAALRGFFDALKGSSIGGLLLTGGDTGALVFRALGVTAILLGGEVAPGIPWGRPLDGTISGLPVVTKSGGFGEEDALIKVVEFLSKL